jgi:hypothetical protein
MRRFFLLVLALGLASAALLHAQDAPSSPAPEAASSPAATVPPGAAATPAAAVETIVLIRHGEKPPDDKGQLNCRGLNRALALPQILLAKFGQADFIFAPLTSVRDFHGKSYSYVRPLMTIEPTAILLGLPVDTRFPEDGIDQLQAELTKPAYRSALIFVAWEHKELMLLVRHLLTQLGDVSDQVPDWAADDYDHIYIVKIRSAAAGRTASFSEDHEMLDGLSANYPAVGAPKPLAH